MAIEQMIVTPILVGQDKINYDARKFLNNTDWEILRHLNQIAQGIPTKLTDVEYQQLLQDRQTARDSII